MKINIIFVETYCSCFSDNGKMLSITYVIKKHGLPEYVRIRPNIRSLVENMPKEDNAKSMIDIILKKVLKEKELFCGQCGSLATLFHDFTIFGSDILSYFLPYCPDPECYEKNIQEMAQIKKREKGIMKDKGTQMSTACSVCGIISDGEARFKVCSRCRCVHYCSEECQKADWKRHKCFCKQQ